MTQINATRSTHSDSQSLSLSLSLRLTHLHSDSVSQSHRTCIKSDGQLVIELQSSIREIDFRPVDSDFNRL